MSQQTIATIIALTPIATFLTLIISNEISEHAHGKTQDLFERIAIIATYATMPAMLVAITFLFVKLITNP